MKSFAFLLMGSLLVVCGGCDRSDPQSSSLDPSTGNEVASQTGFAPLDRAQEELERRKREIRQESQNQIPQKGNATAEHGGAKKRYVVAIAITERERRPSGGDEKLGRVESMLESIEGEIGPEIQKLKDWSRERGTRDGDEVLQQMEDFFDDPNERTVGQFFMKGLVRGADPRFAHAISVKELGSDRFQLILEWDRADEATEILEELRSDAKRLVESEKLEAPEARDDGDIEGDAGEISEKIQSLLKQRDEIHDQFTKVIEESRGDDDREMRNKRLKALKAQMDEVNSRLKSVGRSALRKSEDGRGGDGQRPSKYILHWSVQN